jgi:hypothetical protein
MFIPIKAGAVPRSMPELYCNVKTGQPDGADPIAQIADEFQNKR